MRVEADCGQLHAACGRQFEKIQVFPRCGKSVSELEMKWKEIGECKDEKN